jgi:2-keto-3-deoxy-L-rhamnonate aldolase RhmA
LDQAFRQAVREGRRLLGSFIKIPSHQSVEMMARAGQDFAIVDAEHAPFDLSTLDAMAMAAQGQRLPLLIRPPSADRISVGQLLDMGFCGVLAPHVGSPAAADLLLDGARYDRGSRGFSPSTRAAGYGAPDAPAYRRAADAGNSVWCMIEDAAAIDRIDAIAAIDELDCLFLGRADLSLSLGVVRQDDPKVVEAVRAVADAGRRQGRTVGIYIGSISEVPALSALGISVFMCGSDQSWIMAEGRRLRSEFEAT